MYVITKLVLPMLLSVAVQTAIQAQQYQKLDESYSLELSQTPFATIKILKNNDSFLLKEGYYTLPHLGRFGYFESQIQIDKNGQIIHDFNAVKHKNGNEEKAFVKIKNNILSSIEVTTNGTTSFRFLLQDSATIEQDFSKGQLDEETTVLYTKKETGKKIIKSYYSSGRYSVQNETDSTNITHSADHKIEVWSNVYKKEQRNYDTEGRLKMNVYVKDGIEYWERFKEGIIENKFYKKNDVDYFEVL